MNETKIYPMSYSDVEIKTELERLAKQVQTYPTNNLDDLVKDSVLFNLGYNELQVRENHRHSLLMLVISIASVFIALASLVVAYGANQSVDINNQRQEKNILVLEDLKTEISVLKKIDQNKNIEKQQKNR